MKTTVILQCSACTYRSILRNELTTVILQCSARKRKARNDDYIISFLFAEFYRVGEATNKERLSVNFENLPSKRKFRNPSYSVRENFLVKLFRKSQSKFPKKFLLKENRQKVKCCPTPYSLRSKTFELYLFSKPSGRKTVKGNKFTFIR